MKIGRFACGYLAAFAGFLSVEASTFTIPFQLHRGYLVVVKGSIGEISLNLLVDTGSATTVVDRQLREKLKLRTNPVQSSSPFGSIESVEAARGAELRVGPLYRSH